MLCFPFIREEEMHSLLLHLNSLDSENVLSIVTNLYNRVVMVTTAMLSSILLFALNNSVNFSFSSTLNSSVIKTQF